MPPRFVEGRRHPPAIATRERAGENQAGCRARRPPFPLLPRVPAGQACSVRAFWDALPVRWTRPLQSFFSAGDRLLDRLLCVVGAVLCSQVPEFIQQYRQRLGGQRDEARRQLGQFQEIASNAGLTLDQLIAKSRGSIETTVAQLGQLMHDTVDRVSALSAADAAIRNASMFTRPLVFLRHVDLSVAHATWTIFKPAVPTTLEGAIYAAFGVLLMLAVYHGGVRYPVRRAWRRRAERRARAGQTGPVETGVTPGDGDFSV